MIRIAEVFGPDDRGLQTLSLQCGVTSVVAAFDMKPRPGVSPDAQPCSLASLTRTKTAYEAAGFRVEAIESRPPMEKIKLGLPGPGRRARGGRRPGHEHGEARHPGVVL